MMFLRFLLVLAVGSVLPAAEPWPSFRGNSASGLAPDGQNLPLTWNVASGEGILFSVVVPGLAHSSPILWGDELFLTTAVNTAGASDFKPGLYGSGEASPDRAQVHEWQLHCLDKRTGKTLWVRTAVKGKPVEKRHVKATYANASPATDGEIVVASFGSQGLFAYKRDGTLLWQQDFGHLDAGAYDLPEYEWGTASSPILYGDLVIVQCDTQKDSFIAAFDRMTGKQVWRTRRDELPSWGTPTVYRDGRSETDELVTNGSNFIRGYDPRTGTERWRLGGSSKITAPTPIFTKDLIVVASGRSPERPIFAIKPGGRGELGADQLAWSLKRRGPYMPTPIIVGAELFVLNNNGVFAAYELASGKEHFSERAPHGGQGFSASPVAADGRIYLPAESGKVVVMEAGKSFKQLAENELDDLIMATPAISDGVLYIRGSKRLFAIGK